MSDNGTWQPPGGDPSDPRKGAPSGASSDRPHDDQTPPPSAPDATPLPSGDRAGGAAEQPPIWGQPTQPPQPGYGQSPSPQPGYGQPGFVRPGAGQPAGDPYGRNPYAAQPASGWTPPPRPGLIPLRPLSFGTLMGAPFRELRRNPKATVGSALIIQGATMVLTVLVMGVVTIWAVTRIEQATAEDAAEITSGSILGLVLAAVVPILVSYLGSVFVQGVVVGDVASGTLGEKQRMGALWKRTWPRFGWLLLWTLLTSLAVVIALGVVGGLAALFIVQGQDGLLAGILVAVFGALGLAVLAVWLSTKLAVVPSVIVMEHATIARAVRRSWRLTTGSFWKTFGVLFLIAAILNIAAQVITTPISLLVGLVPAVLDPTNSDPTSMIAFLVVVEVVLVLVTVVIAAISAVVQSAAVALIYIDLRMRREGLDIELIRVVEARQSGATGVPDPYLPRTER